MFCLFVGAGFSKWAANLPLVRELFDFNINPYNKRDYNKLQTIIKYKSTWDNQNPYIKNPEIFIREVLMTSKSKSSLIKWYITRRLSDQFIAPILGGTQALMIDDKRAQNLNGVIKTKNFLKMFPSLSGIVTTN